MKLRRALPSGTVGGRIAGTRMPRFAKAPLTATTSTEEPQRVGRASARSILGLVASGDASIQTAARNGGITEIHHVDYKASNFFGVLAEYTVVVYGN